MSEAESRWILANRKGEVGRRAELALGAGDREHRHSRSREGQTGCHA